LVKRPNDSPRKGLSSGGTGNQWTMARTNTRLNGALRGAVAVGASAGGVEAPAIRSRDGVTVVQHPDDAPSPSMPINALQAGVVDHQVTAINVGALLAKLADREIQERDMEPDEGMEIENRIAMGRRFSTSFRRRGARPALRLHAPRLQRLADERERQQLSVPRRSRVDRRCAAQGARPGMLHRRWRYTDLADEAERAVTVIGRRLSEATSGAGERGDG